MHTRGIYQQLQADLVEHIWKRYNHNNNEILFFFGINVFQKKIII